MSILGTAAPLQGIGRAQKALYIPETAFETIASLTGTRLDIKSFTAGLSKDLRDRNDKRQYPGIFERIEGKQSGTFELASYMLPSGTAGTPPDISPLLEAIGFLHSNNPAVSDTYQINDSATAFSFLNDLENYSELMHGALGTQLKLSFGGDADGMITISGKYSDIKRTGTTTLAAILNATDVTATVTEAEYFEVGGYIQFDGDVGPYKITAVDTATNVLTFSPAAATGAANGSTVSPVIPTGTTAGSPLSGIYGSVTLGGVTASVLSGDVTIDFNVQTADGEYGRNRYSSNYRLVWQTVKF